MRISSREKHPCCPTTRQEKRATRESKWPKSREETPKEGSNNARRYRTATICSRNALKASIFKDLVMLHMHDRLAITPPKQQEFFVKYQSLMKNYDNCALPKKHENEPKK